jgi:TM2 domain-containing membrane protein YozV
MKPASGHIVHADECEIDLKNPYVAGVLAFLIPGAGHFYQGRTNKAYLYAVCILGLFIFGLYLGQGRVVYAAWNPADYRLQFPAQVCVGVPAIPAVVQAWRNWNPDQQTPRTGNAWSVSDFMAPPTSPSELSEWHLKASAGFELGSLFTAVAGLLNLLAIFDAFAGPMPLPHTDERRKK